VPIEQIERTLPRSCGEFARRRKTGSGERTLGSWLFDWNLLVHQQIVNSDVLGRAEARKWATCNQIGIILSYCGECAVIPQISLGS